MERAVPIVTDRDLAPVQANVGVPQADERRRPSRIVRCRRAVFAIGVRGFEPLTSRLLREQLACRDATDLDAMEYDGNRV
jgi:hypothetical protein